MPSHPRPRGFSSGGGSGSSSSGRSAAQNTPMSERQQMALLMQMTSSNQAELSPGGQSYLPARSRDRNERGETALHVAAIKGDHEGVKKLLDQGMSPNVADFAGWTPLHEACNHGRYNVAMMLVKAGANVNAKGLDDDTPLHDAAVMGQLKFVKLLVERGADPCLKNKKGKTPCDVASAPSVYNCLILAKVWVGWKEKIDKADDLEMEETGFDDSSDDEDGDDQKTTEKPEQKKIQQKGSIENETKPAVVKDNSQRAQEKVDDKLLEHENLLEQKKSRLDGERD